MEISILILVLLVVAMLFVAPMIKGAPRTDNYQARELMTENEAEFFGRLVVALPDHYIFPQVAMTALIEAASRDKKQAHADRLRIAQQRADYVVCDRRCNVVAVVELDDRTHSRHKDRMRDARLRRAGIRTVRFESKSKPSAQAVRTAVLAAGAVAEAAQPRLAA
ncbi:DUF2726 domain-containing protein [Massilia sp. YIM B02443]|uniref:DUF2726 domain-containing protein n=1 Tax=Massilia sp. YIM B02443 TaxID=3050127 RepID=UPI0025B65D0C|nr:DUF2726 domain-containing protein [Massilia sp. YIM B02443]MDN4036091.1 DUF2726 domain-containing protein [Massilia sp. YIM B02443]